MITIQHPAKCTTKQACHTSIADGVHTCCLCWHANTGYRWDNIILPGTDIKIDAEDIEVVFRDQGGFSTVFAGAQLVQGRSLEDDE